MLLVLIGFGSLEFFLKKRYEEREGKGEKVEGRATH
jgi:hypothetical protein